MMSLKPACELTPWMLFICTAHVLETCVDRQRSYTPIVPGIPGRSTDPNTRAAAQSQTRTTFIVATAHTPVFLMTSGTPVFREELSAAVTSSGFCTSIWREISSVWASGSCRTKKKEATHVVIRHAALRAGARRCKRQWVADVAEVEQALLTSRLAGLPGSLKGGTHAVVGDRTARGTLKANKLTFG